MRAPPACRAGLPLRQSSPCADRAPFPPLQPGARTFPRCSLKKGILPAWNVSFDRDGSGYVIAGEDGSTRTEGLFVAGDIRKKSLRQVATAVGDGALAAVNLEHYLLGRRLGWRQCRCTKSNRQSSQKEGESESKGEPAFA
jgi:hypothetical protein